MRQRNAPKEMDWSRNRLIALNRVWDDDDFYLESNKLKKNDKR